MKNKKGFKYYLKFWALATLIYSVYIVIISVREGFVVDLVLPVFYLPLVFTFLLFVFDTIFDKIWPQKEKKEDDEFKTFIKTATFEVNEQLELSIEDFRRLRENEKFQKTLYQAYQIFLIGETDEINFTFLNKKFKKDTMEFKAMEVVVNEVKKMMGN